MFRFTASDNVAIAYEQWGQENGGPPVFLCHGYGINVQIHWVIPGVVDALVAAGRHVVLHQPPGTVESDKPHDSRFYGEERMALDVSELIDTLSVSQIDLVGYS